MISLFFQKVPALQKTSGHFNFIHNYSLKLPPILGQRLKTIFMHNLP